MSFTWSREVFSPREIALAAGVPDDEVIAVLGSADAFVAWDDAVHLGRSLLGRVSRGVGPTELRLKPDATSRSEVRLKPDPTSGSQPDSTFVREAPLFSAYGAPSGTPGSRSVPLAISSTLHAAALGAALILTTFGLAPAASVAAVSSLAETPRLVFLATPGPGGGGGGGGRRQPAPPPRARLAGRNTVSSPVRAQRPPAPRPVPPEPPPLETQPLPAVVAPIAAVGADASDRAGVIEEVTQPVDAASAGAGQDGGAGNGAAGGLGPGDGNGVGPGSGGGTGGGPFRPGSGIEAPRLIREVKADYTEEARRRGLEGDVVLEMVVRRDGTVSDIRIVDRLGAGLDERAVAAVRQWRFAPALRLGTPVDVIVEVAVEFKLR
jgi:protein TonB